MKPPPFDYIPCETEDEALACLGQYGDEARILAGGQSLIAMLNMRLIEPRVLADISRVQSLLEIEDTGSAMRIGAAVTQAQLERQPDVAVHAPLLAMALPHVGHFQTRNKGTVCGSLAHADPSGELPLIACMADARIELRSTDSVRIVAAREFYTGLLQTARSADEMIVAVSLPHAGTQDGYAFREMSIRHGDFAIVSVAVKADAGGLTIGIGGSAERPEVRDWPLLEGSALEDALNALAWDLPLQDDVHATAAYRRRLVRALGRQAVMEAYGCRR